MHIDTYINFKYSNTNFRVAWKANIFENINGTKKKKNLNN